MMDLMTYLILNNCTTFAVTVLQYGCSSLFCICLLASIPDDIDEEDLTPEQQDAVRAVEAIESEWIIDPEMRQEMSCINWTYD